ncbi:MAG: hypothetical protein ACFHHU_03360 [Porticoccaceae bacterium]
MSLNHYAYWKPSLKQSTFSSSLVSTSPCVNMWASASTVAIRQIRVEQAADCLEQVRRNRIPHRQGTDFQRPQGNTRRIFRLLEFNEPVYLHQAIAKLAGSNELKRFADLPDFAEALESGEKYDECRVHFHVPVF